MITIERSKHRIAVEGRPSQTALAISLYLLLCALLAACAFDRRFLEPEVIPPQAKKGVFVDPIDHDTSFVLLAGPAWQPTFVDRNNVLVEKPFTIESSVFGTTEGHRLNAWTMRPSRVEPNGTMLLFLHGNGGNITTEYQTVMPLVERGYCVFLFDYSGYGFSTGTASRSTLLSDARAAFAQVLAEKEKGGYHRLLIYGQSLGGHLAVLLAAEVGQQCDGLVSEGAFTSYDDIAVSTSKMGFLARIATKNGPAAKERISQVMAPVLVVHSREDRTIPFAMGEDLFRNAKEPKQFLPISGRHCAAPLLFADTLSARIQRLIR